MDHQVDPTSRNKQVNHNQRKATTIAHSFRGLFSKKKIAAQLKARQKSINQNSFKEFGFWFRLEWFSIINIVTIII